MQCVYVLYSSLLMPGGFIKLKRACYPDIPAHIRVMFVQLVYVYMSVRHTVIVSKRMRKIKLRLCMST